MSKKELRLERTEEGCLVPISHRLNHDGYFRKRIKGSLVMYHRHVWSEVKGEIPEGFEIDHKCKNRACCEVSHLQCLSNKEHTIKDNTGRYSDKRREARLLLKENPNLPSTRIGEIIGVSFGSVSKWRREGLI